MPAATGTSSACSEVAISAVEHGPVKSASRHLSPIALAAARLRVKASGTRTAGCAGLSGEGLISTLARDPPGDPTFFLALGVLSSRFQQHDHRVSSLRRDVQSRVLLGDGYVLSSQTSAPRTLSLRLDASKSATHHHWLRLCNSHDTCTAQPASLRALVNVRRAVAPRFGEPSITH